MTSTVHIFLQGNPRWQQQAQYAAKILCEGIGLSCRFTHDSAKADIAYAFSRPKNFRQNALWMLADKEENWNRLSPKITWVNELPFLGESASLTQGENHNFAGDMLYSAYAILTGCFELPEQKDVWGVPVATGSDYMVNGLLETPIIARYCDHILTKLKSVVNPELQVFPRWPFGKKYVVVLSHDVDAPFSYIDTDYRAKRMRKLLSEGVSVDLVRNSIAYSITALQKRIKYLPSPDNDPNFCFDKWIDFESKLKACSCFYVAVTTSADQTGTPQDVTYVYKNQHLVNSLLGAIDKGWEIGLHPSINSWRSIDLFKTEKEHLESVLNGYSIKGLRHHYWSLDTEIPERTLALHGELSFDYDSSLGLNDAPGFRRGMTWPFNPFNKETESVINVLQIPPTIMDGGIFYKDVTMEEGKGEIRRHIDSVFTSQGAVVMNWHLEQCNPKLLRQAGPALHSVLYDLVSDSDIYWASPVQLLHWWKRRQALLNDSTGDSN